MPQLHPNINPLEELNFPGCLYLDLIEYDEISSFRVADVDISTNLMADPSKWLRITPKQQSLQVSQKVSFTKGQRLFKLTAAGIVSKTDVALTQKFFTLGYKRYCAIITTHNGNRLLLGTKQFPAVLHLKNRKTGTAVGDPNNQQFALELQSPHPLLNYSGTYAAPTAAGINKLTTKNYPGCKYLDICPAQYMINYDDSSFFVNEDIMNNYDFWTRIYFKKETLQFNEAIEMEGGSRKFVSSIVGQLAKVSEPLLDNLFKMGFSRFVAIVTDRNDNKHIVGAPGEPCLLSVENTTTGISINAAPSIEMQLSCSRNRPSKTYAGRVILPGDGGSGDGDDTDPPATNPNAILWPNFEAMQWPDQTEILWVQ